jgi:hypothetical protein
MMSKRMMIIPLIVLDKRVTAPTNGAVGQRHVQEGQLVSPGMQMVDLVKGDPRIQANYLETQIALPSGLPNSDLRAHSSYRAGKSSPKKQGSR